MAAAPDIVIEPRDATPESAWQRALRTRRSRVAARIERRLDAAQLAGLVFDLLVHLALDPDAVVDTTLVESFARRHRLGLEAARIPVEDDRTRPLIECLAEPDDPAVVDAINALFARGFAEKLGPLGPADRQAFTARVVGLLPGVERVGPFALSDYVDLVCAEDDALRFWQVYTERVAAEVSKRSRPPAGPQAPWVLSTLLDLHALHDEAPAPSRAWLALKRHVGRILETGRHRWRFIRALVEGADDPRMLHYICTSPAMVEDPEVLHVFLTRGDGRLVSCALFALHVHGEADRVVGRLLEHLRTRPLPEIGERLVELYAQAHLPARPGINLRRLAVGLRALCAERVRDGAVDSLMQAVRGDARALRQCLLLADLAGEPMAFATPQGKRLVERVVLTFYQAFTPSGITHPLNDAVFRGGVQRALRALLAAEHPRLRERLESFGLELEEQVDRWCPPETPDATRRTLRVRFAAAYAEVALGVCRALYAAPETRDTGRLLYQSLIRVYLEHRDAAEGLAAFGAVEHALPAVFPELLRAPIEALPRGRLVDAAHAIAEIERAYGGGDEGGPLKPIEEVLPVGISPLVARKPDRDKPLVAPVKILRRRPSNARAVLRAYLGLDLLADLRDRLAWLVGVRRRGELRLTDRELIVTGERTLGGRVIERTGDSHALDDLLAVHVRQRMRVFYLVAGLLGLVAAGLVGGHLLFVGVRGGASATALIGGAVIALGVLFDAAMARIAEGNRRSVVLELDCRSRPEHFCLLLDIDAGAEVLDAFMANDAERRELALLERWSELDVAWEPLEEG
ncbi:MAG: hypothetical protein H6701_15100 [Myxococcales bacterium]|nr:hypothetical protein [Myxococcales bacterium]